MLKYGLLLVAITSYQAHAAIIESSDSEKWTVDGLAHYVRSKEDESFSAILVSVARNESVVGFSPPYDYCSYEPRYKKVKIHYQWVNYVSMCANGSSVWVPKSQRGINFVKQKFTSYPDVKVVFDDKTYSFATNSFTSVRQRWENMLRTQGDAL